MNPSTKEALQNRFDPSRLNRWAARNEALALPQQRLGAKSNVTIDERLVQQIVGDRSFDAPIAIADPTVYVNIKKVKQTTYEQPEFVSKLGTYLQKAAKKLTAQLNRIVVPKTRSVYRSTHELVEV